MTAAAAFEINADALHAFADGQLGATEQAAVERFLEAHPEAAAEIAQWRLQNDALHALFDPVAGEPVPARLAPRRIAHDVRTGRGRMIRNLAAAIVLVAVSGSLGWYTRGALWAEEPMSERLIDTAVVAHALYVQENAHAVEAAAGAPNLMRWLSNRIDAPIDAPSLADQGFSFLGGRLLPGEIGEHAHGPAAQLMYENGSAQRVTLYITAALPDKKEVWKFESRGSVEAYYWANDAVTCTIVSDLPEAQVRKLGTAVFEQLTRRPDSSWNPTG